MLVHEKASEGPDTGTDQCTCPGLSSERPNRGAGRKAKRRAGSDTGPGGASAAGKGSSRNKDQRDSNSVQVGLS